MPVDITDVSSNNLHLTNVGNVNYHSEGITPFYRFDGTNYIYYPDATAVEFNIVGNEPYVDDQGLTLMCWARNTVANPSTEGLITKYDSLSGVDRQYAMGTITNSVFFQLSDNGTAVTSSIVAAHSSITMTDWNFFCSRWVANSSLSLFINDSKSVSGSQNSPLYVGNALFKVGAMDATGNLWDGDISMVGVYASALSDDQILTMYEMTAPLFKPSL